MLGDLRQACVSGWGELGEGAIPYGGSDVFLYGTNLHKKLCRFRLLADRKEFHLQPHFGTP
jgi:hypothetical protein